MTTKQNLLQNLRFDITGNQPAYETAATMPAKRSSRWLKPYADFYFFAGFDGIEIAEIDCGRIYQNYPAMTKLLRLNGRISLTGSHPASAEAPRLMKCEIPAPAWLLSLLLETPHWHAYYTSSAALADDIAKAYRSLLDELYAAGCRFVLMYDYSWMPLTTAPGIKQLLQGGTDINRLAETYVSITNQSIDSVPDDMTTALYPAVLDSQSMLTTRRDYSVIARTLFNGIHTDILYLDFDTTDRNQTRLLSLLRPGMKLMLGTDDITTLLLPDFESRFASLLLRATEETPETNNPGIFFHFTTPTAAIAAEEATEINTRLAQLRAALAHATAYAEFA